MGFWKDFEESNENEGHPQSPFTTISAASKMMKKKILAERNADDLPLPYSSNTHLEKTPQEKPVTGFDRVEACTQESHPLSLKLHSFSDSSPSVPYDPVNNYTSPRPAFLRYNPDRRKEILLRMRDEEGSLVDSGLSQDQEKSVEEDLLSVSSTSPKFGSQVKETREDAEDEGDAGVDDCREEEVEKRRPWCFRMVWKLLLLFGVFLLSHHYLFPMNSSSSPIQETVQSIENSSYRNLLKTHMGLSDVCLDIGEGMCGIEGLGSDFVVSDDPVMGHLGDSVKNEFLMPDEVDGELDIVESESVDETEILEERDGDLVDVDSVQNGEEFVVEEGREEPLISSHEFLELEENRQREGSGKEEILGNGTTENLSFAAFTSESIETPDGQFVSDEPHIDQEELIKTNSIEEAQGEESLEFSESQHDDLLAAEESELPTVYKTSSKWKLGLEFASKDVQLLLLLSLSLLALALIGLLSGLFKYFASSHQKSSQMPSPSPVFPPGGKSGDERRTDKYSNVDPLDLNDSNNEEKESLFVSAPSPMLVSCSSVSAVSMKKELKAGPKDSNLSLQSLNYSADKLKGFYATRTRSVELLGEFSIVDGLAYRAASAHTLKSKGFEESEFHKSQWRKGSEESQLSLPERSRTVKINSPSSSSKVHPYLAAESTTAHGSYIVQEKLEKKEDTIAKSEAKKATTTPLRRSSRLQNRVTSPTP